MSTVKELVIGFFQDNEWHYSEAGDGKFLLSHYGCARGRWSLLVEVEEDLIGLVYSLFPAYAPVERRAECADLLMRLNFGGKLGSFDLDMVARVDRHAPSPAGGWSR